MNPWVNFVLILCFLAIIAALLTIAYLWFKFLFHGAYMFLFQDYTIKQALYETFYRVVATILLPTVIVTTGIRSKPNTATSSTRIEGKITPTKPRLEKKKTRWPLKYADLERTHSIRLLAIYPGQYDDSLYGSIIYTNIYGMKDYTALSYTWADESGDTSLSHKLYTQAGFVRITKNCDAAIRRLRRLHDVKKVWIDAICINQSNDLERGHQVARMGDIYCRATSIVVYTGEEDSEIAMLFDWMNAVPAKSLRFPAPWHGDVPSRFPRMRWLGVWLVEMWGFVRSLSLSDMQPHQNALIEPGAKILDTIERYSRRRWFTRIWVLQEVYLPPLHNTTIICGTKTTTSIRALHALSFLPSSASQKSNNLLSIFTLLRKRHSKPNTSHILDILLATRGRSCTDPRDRIFGILSIAHGMDEGLKIPTRLKVDYRLPTAKVYTAFSKYCIRYYGPAFHLALIKSPRSSDLAAEGLPSWCADWTVDWPNVKAIHGKDFPAATHNKKSWGKDVSYTAQNGHKVLTILRPRISRGYFTREGHIDGVIDCKVDAVTELEEGEILVELYRGVAMLLKKSICDKEWTFIRVCPHALSRKGVDELVQRWNDVICDGFTIGIDEKVDNYKTTPQLIRIN